MPSGRAILGIDAQVFPTIGAVGRTQSALIPGHALDINAKVSPAIGAVGLTKNASISNKPRTRTKFGAGQADSARRQNFTPSSYLLIGKLWSKISLK
jgi:hypothetical protein